MVNLCVYCERRKRCQKLEKLNTALIKEKANSPEYIMEAEITVKKCNKFQKKAEPVELSYICFNCTHSYDCPLWEQVSWIDEDFIKAEFEYNPEEQSVGVAVNYCKLFEPYQY